MSFRRQPVTVSSQKDCNAIDFREGFISKEMSSVDELKNEIMNLREKIDQAPLFNNKVTTLDNRFHASRHHSKSADQSKLEKLQKSVSKKLTHIENNFSNSASPVDKHANEDILLKLSNIEKKIENQSIDKNICTHTEQLKGQVFERLNQLESKMRSNSNETEISERLNLLENKILSIPEQVVGNSEKTFTANSECDEEKLKSQVFEKLAILENHMKLKSEIPVVNSDVLNAEQQKLSKLIQMREKLLRGF